MNPPEPPGDADDGAGAAPQPPGDEATEESHHHLGHLHDKLHAARDVVRSAAGEVGAAGSAAAARGAQAATEAAHQAGTLASEAGHQAAVLGSQAAGVATELAGAIRLEVTVTGLAGARALAGHAVGLHKLLPAEGIHGPREAPSLLYVFPDALAVRPTDDAPMSSVPLFGLHLVLPYVAVAHWAYKAGRIVHANLDLAHDDQAVEEELQAWTIDDFAGADPALEVVRVADLSGPVHIYRHLGYVRVSIPVPGGRPVHLKSAYPESEAAYRSLWDLAVNALGAAHVTMDPPGDR